MKKFLITFFLVLTSLSISFTAKAFDIYKCSSDTRIVIGGCGYGLMCPMPNGDIVLHKWVHSEPDKFNFTVLRTDDQVSIKVKSKIFRDFKRENVPDYLEHMKHFGKKKYIFHDMFQSSPNYIHVYNQNLQSFRYSKGKFHLVTELFNTHFNIVGTCKKE